MTDSALDRLRAELHGWRARIDHLRLQAHLGKMELRDELRRIGERLEPAHRTAKERLSELVREGATEAANVAQSLQAGWDEVRRTHEKLVREEDERRRTPGGGERA